MNVVRVNRNSRRSTAAAVAMTVVLAAVGVLARAELAQADWRTDPLTVPSGTDPAVAADNDGNIALAWLKTTGSPARSEVVATRLSADGTEGATHTVATATTTLGEAPLGRPSVALAADGTAAVAWRSAGTIRTAQLAAAADPADGFDVGPVRSVTTLAAEQTEPDVALDTAGNVLVVWEDDESVHATLVPAVGDVVDRVLGSRSALRPATPAVAAGPQGFVVVWAETLDADGDILAALVTVDAGALSASAPIIVNDGTIREEFGPSAQSGTQRQPDVAVGAAGDVFVAWADIARRIDVAVRDETVMLRRLHPDLTATCYSEPATVQDPIAREIEPAIAVGDEHLSVSFGVTTDGVDISGEVAGRLLPADDGCLLALDTFHSFVEKRPVVAAFADTTIAVHSTEAAVLPSIQLMRTQLALTGLQLDPFPYPMPVGTATGLRVQAVYNGADRRDVTAALSSSRPEVLAVDLAGQVVGLAPGNSTITASYGPVSDTVDIEVVALALAQPAASIAVGETLQYRLDIVDADGNYRPAPARVGLWWTSDDTVVRIDGKSGLATALAPGTVTVTAYYFGQELTVPLVVEPAQGRIVFSSDRDGDHELFIANADGTGAVQLTANASDDTEPVLSPDGTRIAFTSKRTGAGDLYLMDVDGNRVVRLTTGTAIDAGPAWSPDGTMVAFSRRTATSTNTNIFTVDADGRNVTRVVGNAAAETSPSWSPDGSRIAYSRARTGGSDIYLANLDGTGVLKLTSNSRRNVHPAWSPDGTRIAFASDRTTVNNYDLWSMNADGTGQTRLTSGTGAETEPAWSPDGTSLVMSAVVDRTNTTELATITADGQAFTVIVSAGGNDASPDWG